MAFQKRSGSRSPDLSVAENPEEAARAILLRHLTRGPKSKVQLARILELHNCEQNLAEALLARYEDVGLIDDQAFSKALVNTRRNVKKVAKSAIKRELLAAGVSETDFESALEGITPDQEFELATELASKKLRASQNLSVETQNRRIISYLARRGFSQGLSAQALKVARQQVN